MINKLSKIHMRRACLECKEVYAVDLFDREGETENYWLVRVANEARALDDHVKHCQHNKLLLDELRAMPISQDELSLGEEDT